MAKKESFKSIVFKMYVWVVLILLIPTFLRNAIQAAVIFFVAISAPLIAYGTYKAEKRRNFFKSRNSLEKIKGMTPTQFEEFISDLFGHLGYRTEKVGGAYDGGIDVIAEKDGAKHFIQCKKFITQQVTVGAMRDFYGAIVDRQANGKAFFITTNVFTLEAEKFAEGKRIELIDGKKLMDYVRMSGIEIAQAEPLVFGSIPEEKCAWCGSPLVLRTARKGPSEGSSFYGCSAYPKCKYIKNIE